MEELLEFFKEKEVAIQITLDLDRKPTVHAFHRSDGTTELYFTEDETIVGALELMKQKLFG